MYLICLALQCIYGWSDEVRMGIKRRGVTFQEEGREWRLPGLLHADDLALCGESDEET